MFVLVLLVYVVDSLVACASVCVWFVVCVCLCVYVYVYVFVCLFD